MRILVTGQRGTVGAVVAAHLADQGHEITGFDIADGQDILDAGAVRRAAAGCTAVVHLAAIANDSAGTPEQIMAVNVLGTWHVLLAAQAAGVTRVVHFSSAQVFGIAEGERLPDYFPLDDAHPRLAGRPYGISKVLTEDMCAGFSGRSGIATICLRPVHVTLPEFYERAELRWQADPAAEWTPFWEFGAFVDARDVASAVECALAAQLDGHVCALLCADDIAASAPSLEMAARLTPDVPVRGPDRYRAEPDRALVDCSTAKTVLGWQPRYRWPARGASRASR
ncbi:MAG TPA: NAD(P)-dependent oxidoreductase [Streptosporangiaceae bacterium]|nr:NAD(P)-dependent oxidoreductase [Streptosporangiaceae bacterium]